MREVEVYGKDKNCSNCKYCKVINTQNDYLFPACYKSPNRGKRCREIKPDQCPIRIESESSQHFDGFSKHIMKKFKEVK